MCEPGRSSARPAGCSPARPVGCSLHDQLRRSAAEQVSVGRLGIITELEFDVIPQQNLTRTGHRLAWGEFVNLLLKLQSDYTGVVAGSASAADVLDPWEGTQVRPAGQARAQPASACRPHQPRPHFQHDRMRPASRQPQ